MAQVSWKTGTSGLWQTGANWKTGTVPASTDDALLGAGAYTVTSTSFVQVNSVQVGAGATLDISSGGFRMDAGTGAGANAGSILIENANDVTVAGTINNSGTISLLSTGNTTDIRLNAATVTLKGGGKVTLSDSATNYFFTNNGANDTLVNVDNTISGAGQFGNGGMGLNNQTKGTISGTGVNNALVINLGGGVVGINAGRIQSTSKGGLIIGGNTTIDSTSGGTIAATGAAGNVTIANATLRGGTLLTTGAGVITVSGGGNTLDGRSGAVHNTGNFVIGNGSNLNLQGSIDNTGTVSVNSTANSTGLILNSPTITLGGGGKLIMSDNANNYISGNNAGFVLSNVDNTISGAGNIGSNALTLVNGAAGTINANATNILYVQTQNLVRNQGLMEGTSGGTLEIYNTGVNNTGGTLLASGGTVALFSSTIFGGTLKTAAGGSILTVSGSSYLDGISFGTQSVAGTVTVGNSTALVLSGTINDAGGGFVVGTGTNTTQLQMSGTVSLVGGGTVTLSNSNANYIQASGGGGTLNNVDNTISGTGNFGNGNLTLINGAAGVINANNGPGTGSTGVMVLNCNGGVTNAGLIEDTGTAGLVISNTNVFQGNAGGTLAAKGPNSHVDLNSSNIVGGKLMTTGTGVIQTVAGTTNGLDGLSQGTVTNAGNLTIVNSSVLSVAGTLNNTGTVNVASTGNGTQFRLNSWTTTLQGGGKVTLSDGSQNYIVAGFSQWQTLNNVDNTISGAGQLGNGGLQFTNSGTVNATGTTNQLVISLGNGSNGTNNASGLWEGSGAAGLVIANGFYTNNGTVEATNGSSVSYTSNAVNLNANAGTLSGGTWEAISTGSAATVSLTGGPIVTDAANLVLSGTGSVIRGGDGNTFTNIENSLTTVAAGGSLSILGGRVYTTTLGLTDNGTMTLGGAATTLTAASLTVNKGALLTGNGTVKTSVTDGGTVTASGGLLDLTKNLSGTGSATIGAGATLEVDGKLTVKSVGFTAGSGEVLALKAPASATSAISGWGLGKTIDLINTGVTQLSYAGTTTSGVLTIKSGTSTVAKLNFTGNYTTASFSFASDGHNGTNIVGTGSLAAAIASVQTSAASDLTSVGGASVAAWHHDSTGSLSGGGASLPGYVPSAPDMLVSAHA